MQAPRVSSYFLLLFVLDVLLVSAASAAAVSSDGAPPASRIEFQQGDKMVKVLGWMPYGPLTPAVSLKIFEPHENRERVYQALPVRPVLDHVFGKEWEKAREIVFTSIDGFQPSIPVRSSPRPSRLLCLRQSRQCSLYHDQSRAEQRNCATRAALPGVG